MYVRQRTGFKWVDGVEWFDAHVVVADGEEGESAGI